ncbi:MAG: glycosyltransferase family 2 protein [bacterium]|nr:glycosyltransferase family 2 protein [bacterium]
MNTPDVSLVIPLYDEADNVAPLCAAVREALAGWFLSYEVVLVDDGSADDTLKRLREEASRDERLRVLALGANSGQTAAMATGFRSARGRAIVSMDGDLQNDPRDIPFVISRLDQGYDVVSGWRRARQDAFLSRTLPSRIANRMIAWMTGIPIHDNGCSLKAYRASVIRSVDLYAEMHRFLPALTSMTGARITEVVVRHHPRTRGVSKYGLSRTFKVLADMLTIKMITQFGRRPGAWFGLLAVPWAVLGLLAAATWLLGLRVFERESSIVFSSLSVMFFFLVGHMLSLAVLAHMLMEHADRSYLGRLARVLTATLRDTRAPESPR